jgi:hypothetical protein
MTASIVTPRKTCSTTHQFAIAPEQFANVAAAQAAGDLAYAFAEASGVTPPERAIAYHVAFADTMRELGSPMPCPCDLCTGG